MGLDMYADITVEPIGHPVDFKVTTHSDLHYWRKHPDLHGWMETLYYAKGGKKDFNCVNVALSMEDLEHLESDISQRTTTKNNRLFPGVSDGSEMEDDLAFVTKAMKATASGYTVFYSSWW